MSVYGYRPSLPANITFAASFTFATFAHAYLGFKWKTPWFMWCMILSCTHEVTGYVARILLWINPWSFGAFITQISKYVKLSMTNGVLICHSCYHSSSCFLLCRNLCHPWPKVCLSLGGYPQLTDLCPVLSIMDQALLDFPPTTSPGYLYPWISSR